MVRTSSSILEAFIFVDSLNNGSFSSSLAITGNLHSQSHASVFTLSVLPPYTLTHTMPSVLYFEILWRGEVTLSYKCPKDTLCGLGLWIIKN